jgi:hypothetical protein
MVQLLGDGGDSHVMVVYFLSFFFLNDAIYELLTVENRICKLNKLIY